MNPRPYIAVFAGISATALTLGIIQSFLVPMLMGAIIIVLFARWTR
jgi:hypothetical protein